MGLPINQNEHLACTVTSGNCTETWFSNPIGFHMCMGHSGRVSFKRYEELWILQGKWVRFASNLMNMAFELFMDLAFR